jgi:hypothetical protein
MRFLLLFIVSFNLIAAESVSDKFGYLEKQNGQQVNNFNNDFSDLNQNKFSLTKQLDLLDSMYTGDSYITKDESKIITKDIKNAMKALTVPKEFLLYFYSESVPRNSVANFLLDVNILRDNGIDIETKQYMVGAPEDYESYMKNWIAYLDKYPPKYKDGVVNNFFMKLDPRFFQMYEVKTVPAIALASCASLIPDPDSCKIKYLIHGDVPLTTFFDKISEQDKKYVKYNKFLDANGIFKNELAEPSKTRE